MTGRRLRPAADRTPERALSAPPAPAGPATAVLALQRAAGNAAVSRVLQRLEEREGTYWSENHAFATNDPADDRLGMAETTPGPPLAGAAWQATGEDVDYDDEESVPLYQLEWDEGGAAVMVPQDCLTTAELVAAWLNECALDEVGEVDVRPSVLPAGPHTAVGPGDILFHVHSRRAGDFHGAAVIGEDGGDVVTMEADASAHAVDAAPPIFDMYQGHAGFRASQDEGGARERTYVIHFDNRKGIPDSLWDGIRQQVDAAGYTAAGVEAANAIKAAIDAAIDAADMEMAI